MEQIEIREGAKRQHRCFAMFCALYCWNHDKKIVHVKKEQFLYYLGLERLRKKRMEWFIEDGGSYFPYIFLMKNNSQGVEHVVLSCVDKQELQTHKEKYKEKAILLNPAIFSLANYNMAFLEEGGGQAQKLFEEAFPYITTVKNYHEFAILNALTLLASGSIDPKSALSKA